jgi:hypothetical protein
VKGGIIEDRACEKIYAERTKDPLQFLKGLLQIGGAFEFRVDGDLLKFYMVLREINPSPYMYFLKMSDRRIIGSSPEMLMKVEDKFVET